MILTSLLSLFHSFLNRVVEFVKMPQGSESARKKKHLDKSSRNQRDTSTSSRVRFRNDHPERNICIRSSKESSVSNSTVSSLGSRFLSRENDGYILTPDMKIEKGDQKCSFQLSDGGKMVKINRVNGEIVYMLRCVDGRHVYIEKTEIGACLIMTNQKGFRFLSYGIKIGVRAYNW